nr:MAG TPA: hypothetical protein [Caudoviricetes sp.]
MWYNFRERPLTSREAFRPCPIIITGLCKPSAVSATTAEGFSRRTPTMPAAQ